MDQMKMWHKRRFIYLYMLVSSTQTPLEMNTLERWQTDRQTGTTKRIISLASRSIMNVPPEWINENLGGFILEHIWNWLMSGTGFRGLGNLAQFISSIRGLVPSELSNYFCVTGQSRFQLGRSSQIRNHASCITVEQVSRSLSLSLEVWAGWIFSASSAGSFKISS